MYIYKHVYKHVSNTSKISLKESFRRNLKKKDWNQLLAFCCNDPNINLDIFLRSVNSTLNRHVPLIRVTKKMGKNCRKSWITRGVLVSIIKRKALQ